MKTHRIAVVLCIILSPFTCSFAQEAAADTTSYEAQRQKVNELLAQRSARFGQFDESLDKRTGIFGLKTKKDMQASIDILKQIVQTDNNIFRETKMLLDFKDFEKSQVEQQASEFDSRINGYIVTISKLQKEQENLQREIQLLQNANKTYLGLFILAIITIVFGLAFLFTQRRKKLTNA